MDAILPLPWTVYLNIHFLPTPHHLLLLLQLLKTSPLSMEKFHSMDRKYKLSEEYQEHTCLYILTYSVSKADISLFSKATFALWSGLFVILWSWESIFLIPFAFKVSSTYVLSIAMLFYLFIFFPIKPVRILSLYSPSFTYTGSSRKYRILSSNKQKKYDFLSVLFILFGSFKLSIYYLVVENGCKLLAVTSVLESVELLESLGDDDRITSSLAWNWTTFLKNY